MQKLLMQKLVMVLQRVRKLSRLLQLSWRDRLLLFQALLLLPAVSLAIVKWGLQPTQRYLAKRSSRVTTKFSPARLATAQRAAFIVNRAAGHLLPEGSCLKRSLTLWFLLRRRGIASDLRIGVRQYNGEFQAHAWIEYGNRVVNDLDTIQQYYSVFEERFDVLV